MGTSTNYSAGPNWAPVKSETTQAGGQGFVTPQKAQSIISGVVSQMARAPSLGFGSPLSGGRSDGSQGRGRGTSGGGSQGGSGVGGGPRSRIIGGASRSVARGLGHFLSDVSTKGFRDALAECGLTNLDGKSPDEIALALADVLGGPASLIEDAALRDALMEMTLEWSENAKDIEELDVSVRDVAQNIERTLHEFFGHYIFQVFKTVGYQGVLEKHGFEKVESMAAQIREFIDAKISGVEMARDLSTINWTGHSGAEIVNGIVRDTMEIFGGGES